MFELHGETVEKAEEIVQTWLRENTGGFYHDPITKAEKEKVANMAMRILEIAADLEGIKESALKRQSIV
jgi:hypothetical protein